MRQVRGSMNAAKVTGLFSLAEEGDTWMLLHAKQSASASCYVVVIQSSDTGVMVLSIYFQQEMDSNLIMQQQGKKKACNSVDLLAIGQTLGEYICNALLWFQPFPECDTTCVFTAKGKKTFKLLHTNIRFHQAMNALGQ